LNPDEPLLRLTMRRLSGVLVVILKNQSQMRSFFNSSTSATIR
jgi:hypothetical protein